MGGKKEKVLPRGKATDCPDPPHVTPGSGVWRSTLPTCSMLQEPPPVGPHRWDGTESRPSALCFIDSCRPGAVTHNRGHGEMDGSFMRNATLKLFCTNKLTLHKHTHSKKKERPGGIKATKAIRRLLYPKKQNKTQVLEERWMEERLGRVWGERHEFETDLVRGENTVGAETSIYKCSQMVSGEWLTALSKIVKAQVAIQSLSDTFVY